jgi:hypothetical protein
LESFLFDSFEANPFIVENEVNLFFFVNSLNISCIQQEVLLNILKEERSLKKSIDFFRKSPSFIYSEEVFFKKKSSLCFFLLNEKMNNILLVKEDLTIKMKDVVQNVLYLKKELRFFLLYVLTNLDHNLLCNLKSDLYKENITSNISIFIPSLLLDIVNPYYSSSVLRTWPIAIIRMLLDTDRDYFPLTSIFFSEEEKISKRGIISNELLSDFYFNINSLVILLAENQMSYSDSLINITTLINKFILNLHYSLNFQTLDCELINQTELDFDLVFYLRYCNIKESCNKYKYIHNFFEYIVEKKLEPDDIKFLNKQGLPKPSYKKKEITQDSFFFPFLYEGFNMFWYQNDLSMFYNKCKTYDKMLYSNLENSTFPFLEIKKFDENCFDPTFFVFNHVIFVSKEDFLQHSNLLTFYFPNINQNLYLDLILNKGDCLFLGLNKIVKSEELINIDCNIYNLYYNLLNLIDKYITTDVKKSIEIFIWSKGKKKDYFFSFLCDLFLYFFKTTYKSSFIIIDSIYLKPATQFKIINLFETIELSMAQIFLEIFDNNISKKEGVLRIIRLYERNMIKYHHILMQNFGDEDINNENLYFLLKTSNDLPVLYSHLGKCDIEKWLDYHPLNRRFFYLTDSEQLYASFRVYDANNNINYIIVEPTLNEVIEEKKKTYKQNKNDLSSSYIYKLFHSFFF